MAHKLAAVIDYGPPFDDATAFGAAVREAREKSGIGISALAEALGTTRQRLTRIEQGKEGSGAGRKPAERWVIAVAVAEVTGRRDLLGLAPREPEISERVAVLSSVLTELVRERNREDLLEQLEQVAVSGQRLDSMPQRSAAPGPGAPNG